VDYRGSKKLTPEVALKTIDEILSGASERVIDGEQQMILSDLKRYLISDFSGRQ